MAGHMSIALSISTAVLCGINDIQSPTKFLMHAIRGPGAYDLEAYHVRLYMSSL